MKEIARANILYIPPHLSEYSSPISRNTVTGDLSVKNLAPQ